MKMMLRSVPFPVEVLRMGGEAGSGWKPVRCCEIDNLFFCMVAEEMGLLHMSLSHPHRQPTWDEIKEVRYALLPDEKTFAVLLPPKSQYVNLHENCFHLWEVPEMHEAT